MANCPWPGQSSNSINLHYGSNAYSVKKRSAHAGSWHLKDQTPELFLWEVLGTYVSNHRNKNGTQILNDEAEVQGYSS